MHSIRVAKEGKVQVVVDDEKGAGGAGQVAEATSQEQELAPGQELVAKLQDLSASAQGRRSEGRYPVGVMVRGDDVEAGGEEPLEEGLSRGAYKVTACLG
jgi:hypothetical protein